MKRILTILIFVNCLTSYGQIDTLKFKGFDFVFTPSDTTLNCVGIDKFPEYKGGFEELVKFIGKNIKYPEKAINDSIQGRVFLTFIVKSTGQVVDREIKKGLSLEIDLECKQMLNKMPDWNPAIIDNKPIDYRVTFPITFKLRD
ncbi:MAG: TonB family protein [Bacteroidales bacterium]|nr:TonB family protein [Bacteroidales bacterium]